MPTGGCYDNCEVKIGKTKIKKKYYGEDDITIKNFNNELKVYKLAKKNKISYIPKLISYSKKDMELVIEKTGISLKQYLKENGFLVSSAQSAEEAYERVSIIKFDMV